MLINVYYLIFNIIITKNEKKIYPFRSKHCKKCFPLYFLICFIEVKQHLEIPVEIELHTDSNTDRLVTIDLHLAKRLRACKACE